jgi:hypothetical protein
LVLAWHDNAAHPITRACHKLRNAGLHIHDGFTARQRIVAAYDSDIAEQPRQSIGRRINPCITAHHFLGSADFNPAIGFDFF